MTTDLKKLATALQNRDSQGVIEALGYDKQPDTPTPAIDAALASAALASATTPEKQDLSECQNCGKIWEQEDLSAVEDVMDKVATGEPMPSGQCPDCGAVCHPVVDRDTSDEVILVVVEGGIVQDVLSNKGRVVDSEVWDWNDFEDGPVTYWEEKTEQFKKVYKQTVHPSVYAEMIKTYTKAKKQEDEDREEEQAKDPFRDVPAC